MPRAWNANPKLDILPSIIFTWLPTDIYLNGVVYTDYIPACLPGRPDTCLSIYITAYILNILPKNKKVFMMMMMMMMTMRVVMGLLDDADDDGEALSEELTKFTFNLLKV